MYLSVSFFLLNIRSCFNSLHFPCRWQFSSQLHQAKSQTSLNCRANCVKSASAPHTIKFRIWEGERVRLIEKNTDTEIFLNHCSVTGNARI